MRIVFLIPCLIILLSCGLLNFQLKTRTIKSPDNKIIVKIFSTGKSEDAGSESKIELRTVDGKLLKTNSFLPKDHSHGLYIHQAQRTSESKYFVFNTTISGSSTWAYTNFFLDKGKNKIEKLDPNVGIWVLSDFKLSETDSITVEVSNKMPDGEINWNVRKKISLNNLVNK